MRSEVNALQPRTPELRPQSDEEKLKQFSSRIFRIKFMVFEVVLLGCFLFVLYLVVKHELGF
jgi:hypothetical protein